MVKGTVTDVPEIELIGTVALKVPLGMPLVNVAGPETVAPLAPMVPVAVTVIVVLTGLAACALAQTSIVAARNADMRNMKSLLFRTGQAMAQTPPNINALNPATVTDYLKDSVRIRTSIAS
ncbi:MAG: hypothetical protein P4L56_13810 [Candidatus Sulfopaludibacter sp.]|nr:hypothetical protein [Candidatus Sulfopaludibacter sp.]